MEREPDPSDGRRIPISITAAGRQPRQVERGCRAGGLEERIAQHLDANERRQPAATLPLFRRLADDGPAPG